MTKKTWFETNVIISIILSLYFSIRGSTNHGWFSCLGFTKIMSCTILGWLAQIIALLFIFLIILTLIELGLKYLFKKTKKKENKVNIKKIKEVKKEDTKKVKEETKEKAPEKEKKVITI